MANTPIAQLLYARDSLANSANFQTLVGAADATAAKTHIRIAQAPAASGQRPEAFLFLDGDDAWVLRSTDDGGYMDRGTIKLVLQWEPTAGTDDGDTFVGAFNTWQPILTDLMDQKNTAGRLNIREIEVFAWPFPTPYDLVSGEEAKEGTGVFWEAAARLHWGPDL